MAGLWLLVRGSGAFRDAALIAGRPTSRIASLAVGDVRVTAWPDAWLAAG